MRWSPKGGKERILKRIGSGIATLVGNDIDDDGSSDDGRDGIEGNDAFVAWQDTEEVRQQSNSCTCHNRGWHEALVVLCT